MIRYITSRPLWANIAIAIGVVIVIILLFLLSLNWITRHGESRTVPSIIGKNVKDAENFLQDKGFTTVIQDSVYYDSLPPGAIIRQVPEADEIVKINRTVYVTINRFVPPDVEMPNLLGSSFRNAEMVLRNLGLRVGDTSYRFDFAKNSVLEQLFNGASVKPGTKLKVGSKISFVLGSGLGNEEMAVPDLIGLTYDEAKAMLDANGLTLGAHIFNSDVRDSSNAYVYWQSITPRTEDGLKVRIRAGQMIDIRMQAEKPASDSTGNQPPQLP
ncbi:MAG TPA: PASTA domain-containing protein [Flavisolibacter sp.]|jgi:hypothetical protein|nr:PASTA domain-containing protein [Flavisolibacter sp.]